MKAKAPPHSDGKGFARVEFIAENAADRARLDGLVNSVLSSNHLYLVIKQPVRRLQSAYQTFLRVVEAPTRKAAIEKAQAEAGEHFNNEQQGQHYRSTRDYQNTKAKLLIDGANLTL